MSKKLASLAGLAVLVLVGAGCAKTTPTSVDTNVVDSGTQLSMSSLVGEWTGAEGGSAYDKLILKEDGTLEGMSGTYKTTGKWSYKNNVFIIRGDQDNVGDVTFENPMITPDKISGMNKEIDMEIEFTRIK